MIATVEKLLKKLGVISSIDDDEIINASIENSAKDFEGALDKLRESLKSGTGSIAHLRQSIAVAKERTSSFAEFERMTAGRRREVKK
jgi:hypothetical protein